MLAAGDLLPILIFAAVLLFYRGDRYGPQSAVRLGTKPERKKPRKNSAERFRSDSIKRVAYHLGFAVFAIAVLSPLLLWILSPIFYDGWVWGDDITSFLHATKISPFLVSAAAAIITAAMVFYIIKKGLPAAIVKLVKESRAPEPEPPSASEEESGAVEPEPPSASEAGN
jgi:hypothetical protein